MTNLSESISLEFKKIYNAIEKLGNNQNYVDSAVFFHDEKKDSRF
jgi:hypothetical protein